MAFKTIFFLLLINKVNASVWETQNQWSPKWEEKYREWVKSDAYHKEIYLQKGPLGAVKTDCADAVFGTRIIFSYLNKLPFAVGNATGDRTDRYPLISNELTIWDDLADQKRRVALFIEYIGETVGTDYLARHATFSVNPKNISAGDAYVYKKQSSHAYTIKRVEATGNQRLFWSTTPKTIRELSEKVGLPGSDFEAAPWGYRRFKWPEELNLNAADINEERGISNLQYEMLKPNTEILKEIRKLLAVENENLTDTVNRYFKNICMAMADREKVISITQDYMKSIGNRCVTASEFDDYSTPTRDNRIVEEIDDLISIWKESVVNQQSLSVNVDLRNAMTSLISMGATSSSGGGGGFPFPGGGSSSSGKVEDLNRKKLNAICSVNVPVMKGIKNIDILDYYLAKRGGRMSSHPNDNLARRWGVEEGKKTTCKEF